MRAVLASAAGDFRPPAGYAVTVDVTTAVAGIVVAGGHDGTAAARRWRAERGERAIGILWLTADPAAAFAAGADACLPPDAAEEVVAGQLAALARIADLSSRIDDARTLAERLTLAHARADRDRAAARAVQRTLAPGPVRVPGWTVGVFHASRARVGGDCFAAGPQGLFLCDAPETLLGLFAGRAGGGAGSPGELLSAVNRAILDLNLPDSPFATGFAVQLSADGGFAVARAGTPTPVRASAAAGAAVFPVPGPILGAFAAAYPTRAGTLAAGEKLILCSDGFAEAAVELRTVAARLAHLPADEFAAAAGAELLPIARPDDDVTLVVLEAG